MTLNEYQRLSGKFEAPGMDREQRLRHAVCGLASEVCELIEKARGRRVIAELTDEAGDVAWFIARICAVKGIPMVYLSVTDDDVWNVKKFGAENALIGDLGRVEGIFQKELTGRTADDTVLIAYLREMLCAAAFLTGAVGQNVADVVENILEKNIAKLKVRYPDGFSVARALNRDLEAEKDVFRG